MRGLGAARRLKDLAAEVTAPPPALADVAAAQAAAPPCAPLGPAMAALYATPAGRDAGGFRASLLARVQRRLGIWLWTLTGKARAGPARAAVAPAPRALLLMCRAVLLSTQ